MVKRVKKYIKGFSTKDEAIEIFVQSMKSKVIDEICKYDLL